MKVRVRKQLASGTNYLLLLMWIVVLLGWFYATVVLIIDCRSRMENQSPNKAGHFDLQRR